ncbi:MAG: ATP phosphoribosyltransferase [Thermoleophilia bacterium]|nr:ATP phosphoribosyltransferase [Thermoleophilia bacterium]
MESPLEPGCLRIAVPRGNLFSGTVDLLENVGFDVGELRDNERKLTFEVGEGRTIISTRPADVPTYVEYGAADAGIVGKDVLLEQGRNVYELADLEYGACRIVYATPAGRDPEDELRHLGVTRVATKYPNIARRYFEELGMQVEVIELKGSIELAPQVDLAEGIVDLTATGETLRQNNLVERAEIDVSTARFIANRVSHKLKARMIDELARRLVEASRK